MMVFAGGRSGGGRGYKGINGDGEKKKNKRKR